MTHHWGRVTLSDMVLTIYQNRRSESRTLHTGQEYTNSLVEHFGIDVDAHYEDFTPLEIH
jgi:arylamine N-acetyltransferase